MLLLIPRQHRIYLVEPDAASRKKYVLKWTEDQDGKPQPVSASCLPVFHLTIHVQVVVTTDSDDYHLTWLFCKSNDPYVVRAQCLSCLAAILIDRSLYRHTEVFLSTT
jgi:hypothetical protein